MFSTSSMFQLLTCQRDGKHHKENVDCLSNVNIQTP